jgi:hypothetical protein
MQTCDSQMSLDTLRKVSADDIPKLCEVLARAFANDSIARYVLPDDDSRERRLRRLYRVYFSVFLRHGSCYTDAGLKGAALWLPPNLIRPILSCCDDQGLGAYLETGTESNLPFYSKHGFTVMRESRIKNGPRLWHLWREPLFRNPAVAW